MSWKLAPSLVRLRDEVNARWPQRSKVSDGTIGDARHAATTSDHNPNKRGMVNALDITASGVDTSAIIAAVIAHPATNYVIFDRKIYSRKDGFKAKVYTGSNPHTAHIHISILQTEAAEQSAVSWMTPKPAPKPVVKYNLTKVLKKGVGSKAKPDAAVKTLQSRLGMKLIDGVFGSGTETAVKAFQRNNKLKDDGVVGEKTARTLGWLWRGK